DRLPNGAARGFICAADAAAAGSEAADGGGELRGEWQLLCRVHRAERRTHWKYSSAIGPGVRAAGVDRLGGHIPLCATGTANAGGRRVADGHEPPRALTRRQ